MFRSILVATHGRVSAEGAVRGADRLARRHNANVEMLNVSQSPLTTVELPQFTVRTSANDGDVQATIAEQLDHVLGECPAWPMTLATGHVAPTICRIAKEHGSDLILLGRGRHRALDRVFGSEIAVHVAHRSTVPMLATTPDFDWLPSNVLVGTDFSRASIRAARAACAVMGSGSTMHVVHVRTAFEPFPSEPAEPDGIYAAGIDALFRALEAVIAAPSDVRLVHVIVDGDPITELRQYASRKHIDLIAVGSHGRSSLKRRLLGSVAAGMIRSTACNVLVSGLDRAQGSQ